MRILIALTFVAGQVSSDRKGEDFSEITYETRGFHDFFDLSCIFFITDHGRATIGDEIYVDVLYIRFILKPLCGGVPATRAFSETNDICPLEVSE